jgi:glycerate dehydrogenase
MKNIVVIGDFEFSDALIEKIKSLGKVSFIVNASSATDWLQKVQGADVICSDGDYLLENLSKLKNVFITYPFIELGAFDTEQLKKNGVFIANAKGSSRDSIVEWVLFATLALFRKFTKYANSTKELSFERSESLNGKKALIIGKGDIGKRIGEIYEELGIDVDYFQREIVYFRKLRAFN